MAKNTQRTTKLAFKCQPCDEFSGRDRTYTRSYDLIAHLVNTHDLYPTSIKHNVTYLPLKTDLRTATADEIAKYKDASRHGRKKGAETTSAGEASASVTTVEPEGTTGTGKVGESRKSKGEVIATSSKIGKSGQGGKNRDRDEKETATRIASDRDEERKAKETADERDAAEDEADQREYIALQSKIEARRLARDIQAAHDTLATLRAEQEDASTKTGREKDKTVPTPTNEGKKSRANRPAGKTTTGEARMISTTGATRRGEEGEKSKAGEEGQTDIATEPKKVVAKVKAKRPAAATELPRKNAARTAPHSSDDDTIMAVLGPALVAGALGRKIGDARTASMMRGITECRVELLTTRQKARLPLPEVPHNSAESNSVAEIVGAHDGRLSLSATDLHVQLELPGEVTEPPVETTRVAVTRGKTTTAIAGAEPRRISLTPVTKSNDDRRTRDGVVDLSEKDEASIGPKAGSDDTPVDSGGIATSAAIATAELEGNATRTAEGRRMLREIDVAEAMREQLAETNPELVSAASFLDGVYGRVSKKPGASEATSAKAIEPTAIEIPKGVTMGQPLRNTVPPSRSVPGHGCEDLESDSDPETTDIVVVGDTEMSEGETSDDVSDSQSSSDSSPYSSGQSRASRKRAAENSLEREPRKASRHPCPGAASRSDGGCRILLPTHEVERTATDEMATGEETAIVRSEPTGTARRKETASYAVNETGVPQRSAASGKETTVVNTDTTTYPCPAIAFGAPFVVRNTVVNVPVQLLSTTSACATSNINREADVGGDIALRPTVGATTTVATVHAATSMNAWGQHGFVIAEIYKVLASMEPPWGSLCVCEEMTRRFPAIEPSALQMAVLAVLMTQRQCVRDLTLAGARRGPRRDENGEVFIELDLIYANRYSDSY